jgi:2-methylcitrate dehydratase PrpD
MDGTKEMSTPPLTREAGAFVAGISADALPERAVAVARLGFTDTIACILAGLDEPVTRIIRDYAAGSFAPGEVPALLGRVTTTSEGAALIDATAAHALDFDDYAFSNHVSAVLVPTTLAAAHGAPDPSGARMVAAYVAGYEVWACLMTREPDHLHSKGWHPTAVHGPVAAAAAAAVMRGLDADAATNALALAASHAGGLMANFGTMTKPYHAGRAAEAGLRAVRLTQAGLTAQPVALEAPTGLMSALSPEGRVDLSSPARFGEDWAIVRHAINIKKYPTVGASQRCIDAILALEGRDAIATRPEDIASIVPSVSKKHAAVMPFADPASPAEAKFSLPFACSTALLRGRVGLAELKDEALSDPVLRALMAKVSVHAHEDYDPDYPVAARVDVVTVTMADGTEHSTPEVWRATGHADAPLSSEEHWTKFADCAAAGGLGAAQARALFEACNRFDAVSGPAELHSAAGL